AWAAEADPVMVTLSRGLGCPAGSLLAGDAGVIEQAWRIRRRLGGGMRQIGLLAAAGLHALDHHRTRLAEDHARARTPAAPAREVPGPRVVEPETNIVMLEVEAESLTAPVVVERLAERGVRMSEFTARRIRAVTPLDVDDEGIRRAAAALAEVVGAVARG